MRIKLKRKPKVYYNENDPFAAAWLKQLIAKNLIAQGDVDDRSIEEVKPSEIENYTQAHFFAGIGVWSYALRNAGWKDEWPVWTGSCPCQPFSVAGKAKGFADKRHLWPCWFKLIEKCAPVAVFGEQVASKDGLTWFDLVSANLERAGYTVGAVDTCAAGFGAPHIRQRLYFVAESLRGRAGYGPGEGLGTQATVDGQNGSLPGKRLRAGIEGSTGELANPKLHRWRRWEHGHGSSRAGRSDSEVQDTRPGATNGFWRDAEWIPCRSVKTPGAVEWRAIKPGTFPLANESAARVVRLRGYGNAIVAEQAKAFIEAYMDIEK